MEKPCLCHYACDCPRNQKKGEENVKITYPSCKDGCIIRVGSEMECALRTC